MFKHLKDKTRMQLLGYLFIAPAVIIFILFQLSPIILSIVLSFTNYNGYTFSNINWTGLNNFKYMFQYDEYFFKSLKNMGIYCFAIIPTNIVLSLILASLLSKKTKSNTFFRAIYYIPCLTSAIATAVVWKYLYDPNVGLVNRMLATVELDPITLSDIGTAKLAIIIVTLWMGLGGNIVMYIAAIQNVPDSLYEAAKIEGANSFQIFRKVTIPLIRPVTVFILTMLLISTPQMFEQVLILTGINSISVDTQTPVLMIYNNITQTGGLASLALVESLVLFALIILVTLITQRVNKETYF